MSKDTSEFDPVGRLATEFIERRRRGESPTIAEYARRHPDLEERIRSVFPMMLLMEDHAPDSSSGTCNAESQSDEVQLDRLGDFRILREVGRGGMGIVYEAVQESLGRHVALKVFPTHSHLNPRHRERFKRESRSAAMLHHTNIVPVFAVGDKQGMLYYAMQYIRGAGLDEVITELVRLRRSDKTTTIEATHHSTKGPVTQVAEVLLSEGGSIPRLSESSPSSELGDSRFARGDGSRDSSIRSAVHLPGQSTDSTLSESGNQYWHSVARIGVQVADALAYAHGQGTMHRDIKPSNLLLDQNATVWVTDFGLAKSIEQEDLTHTGELIGTLRYMPPEQFSGKADERSDLYSLGLTLYELLTLRPAFDTPDRDRLIRAITDKEPTRPRKINSRIPRDLETIVCKAIERAPAGRYQTACDLARDLTRFLNNEPIQARPTSTTERVIKWAKRRPAIAILTTALVVVFLAAFGLVTWKWRDAEAARNDVRIERDQAQRERERKEVLLEESERHLYYSLIAQADGQLGQNSLEKARYSLSLAEQDRRGWEWRYLYGQLHADLMTLQAGSQEAPWIRSLAFSLDGKLLATGAGLPDFVSAKAGSPGVVRVWDVVTGRKILDLGDKTLSVSGIAISPNGKRLAVSESDVRGSYSGRLRIWDIASGVEIVTLLGEVGTTILPPNLQLRFSPDGKLLAAKSRRPWSYRVSHGGLAQAGKDTLRVWDAVTGRQLWNRMITNVSFHFTENGSRILTRIGDDWGEVDARSGEVIRRIAQAKVGVYRDPTGRHAINWGGNVFGIHDLADGRLVSTVRDPHGWMDAFAVRPDGRQLATASLDGTVRVWYLESGAPMMDLRGHSDQLISLDYSPDGSCLASGGWQGLVKVWATSRDPRYLRMPAGRVEDVAFRFGGRAVASLDSDGSLATWDASTGERLQKHQLDVYINSLWGPTRQAAFDGSGSRIAGAAKDDHSILKVWDVESGQEQLRISGHQATIHLVALSNDGRRVAAAAGNFPAASSSKSVGSVKVWNVETEKQRADARREILEVANAGQRATAMAMSPDGKRLALCAEVTGPAAAGRSGETVTDILFGIWDVDSGRELPLPKPQFAVHGLAFSLDGKKLASCGRDGRVRLFDGTTGKVIISFKGPSGLEGLAFSPDGERLAGANRDLTTVWDAVTGHEVITLRGARKKNDSIFNPAVRFGPNGRHLVATQWDRSMLQWTAPDVALEASAAENHDGLAMSENEGGAGKALLNYLAELEQSVLANPTDAAAYVARGRLHARVGNHDKAAADYARVKELRGKGCLVLTGHEHIAAPHLSLDETGSVTVEAWIKDWTGFVVYQGYGYDGVRDVRESTLQFNPLAGQTQSGQSTDHRFRFVNNYKFKFGVYKPGMWTHLAVVYDARKQQLLTFANGVLAARTDEVKRLGPFHPGRPFWIGHSATGSSSRGLMRSLRVSKSARYSQAFTAPEKLAADDDTMLLFDFARHQGGSQEGHIPDLSGNGNHGKICGAWWVPASKKTAPPAPLGSKTVSLSRPTTGTRSVRIQQLESISAIVKAEPGNGRYLLARGEAHARAGNHREAGRDYAAAKKMITGVTEGVLLASHQYVEAPHIPFDQLDGFTIEAWVWNWQHHLVYQSGAYEPGLLFDHAGGNYCFRSAVDDEAASKTGVKFANAIEYGKHAHRFRFRETAPHKWIHLAVVYDDGKLRSFTDGELVSEVNDVPRPKPLARNRRLMIGGLPRDHYLLRAGRAGQGVLRSIRVSKTARYSTTFSPSERLDADAKTVLLFDFSKEGGEQRGSHVPDLSGSGNHGTFRNAWWR